MNSEPLALTRTLSAPRTARDWLQRFGELMAVRRRVILGIQWTVVGGYVFLVAVPAFLPLPPEHAHLWNNLTRFAQFAFWGIWWPFVILSMPLLGRVWCGVFCPEGALTEAASRIGLGRKIPRWMRWPGWPFVAFTGTTIYGQLVSVYEYPKPALLILGGSTIAAVAVGLVYGREKRVWCRYLCPVNGVFRLLARLAPLHFRTDAAAWRRAPAHAPAPNCAPLLDMRHLKSAAPCHACGRCAGYRGAITLAPRSPNTEILALQAGDASRWEALLLIFGVFGVAIGAFQWTASPWFVALKQALASWLIDHNAMALLQDNAPWWLLTHYPEINDVFSWLDGLCILFYIAASSLAIGGAILAALHTAQAVVRAERLAWHLAYCLIPLAAVSVFLGLSMLTLSQLAGEDLTLAWLPWARAALLAAGVGWSGWLTWRALAAPDTAPVRRVGAFVAVMAAAAVVVTAWVVQFYVW
jgi:polyferredoxin